MDKRLRYIGLLRCFAAAAKHQSYSVAAQELAISQAAVSQQIRSLEQVLGTRLFVRSGRNMRLTPQGEVLSEHVGNAFNLLSQGFDQVQQAPLPGVLQVTTGLSFASIWLVPRLWKFANLYPDIKVKIVVSDELENLRHSDLDIAIRQGDTIDTSLFNETLFVDPIYPVCSPKLLEHMQVKEPQDLLNCILVEAERPGRFSWENWFELANSTIPLSKRDWLEVSTLEMGINAVLAGHGVCLGAHCLVKNLIEDGLLVKPFDIEISPGLRFTFLYDQHSPKRERIKVFHQWLQQELAAEGINSARMPERITPAQ
ncbi:LysR substrate-binding domain-containing protein [Neptunicella sp. SCSIO 80796]|uniref:LysR substrate-binding domain-containing protein n=1 Tax=Neptunicella plasticusilytica TaxID=3117012 RepID=UPI003A4D35DD